MRTFAIYSGPNTVHHLQMTNHLFSQRPLQSRAGGFKWNVDLQVADVALQAKSVTSRDVPKVDLFLLCHSSDVSTIAERTYYKLETTVEYKWPQTPKKKVKLDTFQE